MIPGITAGRAAPGGGGIDPYFANVVALLHMDGTNGSTTIVDDSPSPKTWSCNATAVLNTATKKFGPSSLALNGSHNTTTGQSSVSTPDDADFDFGSGNFTLEAWVFYTTAPNSFDISHTLFAKRASSAVLGPFYVALNYYMGQVVFLANAVVAGPTPVSVIGTVPRSAGSFYHVALTRSGADLRLFVDGVQDGPTASLVGALVTNSNSLQVGAGGDTRDYAMDGFVDDLRITKGVARYTADFTPPAAPFPNS